MYDTKPNFTPLLPFKAEWCTIFYYCYELCKVVNFTNYLKFEK